MSRHIVPLKFDVEATEAVVGWDRPLQTFFVQVFRDDGNGEDEAFIWEGTEFGEIETPEAAIRFLEPYCLIPNGLSATLQIERMKTLAAHDGPAQQDAKAFLAKLNARRLKD
ncbi:hypothetical protein [Croceicoccus hydrothermalis]|jgi:hypothetical protein|uniref:hypothetical protein n=1 Tax=Croceicoccus hydrothermalis TaxID=2867964 RepID=UPI001EFBBA91|nr:hypothetical protein [Croceicoccus hydrothermalis]